MLRCGMTNCNRLIEKGTFVCNDCGRYVCDICGEQHDVHWDKES